MIETHDDEVVGEVSCYCIDGDREKLAIGIGIPPLSARRKGYAYAALTLFMEHLFETRDILYTQTWSGNVRMLALAEKLGFKEVIRLKNLREVDGKKYDGLTFAVTKTEFIKLSKNMIILRKITDDNYDDLLKLRVTEDQSEELDWDIPTALEML